MATQIAAAGGAGRRWRLTGFQKLALATTIATYFLIMVGGFVRAAGAGLGCPDWPHCFGYWIPPSEASMIADKGFDPALFNKTLMWIEYGNRLVGVAVGFLILATTVAAVRHYRKVPRILWPTVAAFVLVLFQGWLGGKVVDFDLAGWIVTAHLVLALVIVILLLYATVCAFFPGGQPLANVPAERRRIARYGQGLVGFGLVQLTLGALVRGHIDDVASKTGLPRDQWLAQVGLTDHLHRISALALTAAVLAVAFAVLRNRQLHPWLHRTAWSMAGLVLIQVAAGIGLAYGALPPPLQTTHIIAGTLLIGVFTMLVLLAYRLPVDPGRPAPEARAAYPAAR
jgi:cytochrome c oxidase assembly protein subunit 15